MALEETEAQKMSVIMGDTMLPGLLFLAMGGVSVYWSKFFAKHTAAFYTKTLHRQFHEAGYRLMFVCVGIAFIAVGVLELLGIL